MDISGRRLWLRAMILVAVAYGAIGIVFAALAADANHVRLWRLAAWLASAAVAAVHIGYEHYRLRSSPRPTALHAAGAVALGAFGLALAANGWNTRPTPAAPRAPRLASHHCSSGVSCGTCRSGRAGSRFAARLAEQRSGVWPNKRLKLPGGDRSKGSGVLCPGGHELSFNDMPRGGRVARSLSAIR